jgi:hypothetical protein
MSVTWMAVIAALIALDTTVPWRRAATGTTVVILLALGVLVLVAPDVVPALTRPGPSPAGGMPGMGS